MAISSQNNFIGSTGLAKLKTGMEIIFIRFRNAENRVIYLCIHQYTIRKYNIQVKNMEMQVEKKQNN